MEEPQNRDPAPPAAEREPQQTTSSPDAASGEAAPGPSRGRRDRHRRRRREPREDHGRPRRHPDERPHPNRALVLDPDMPRPEHPPEIATERLDADAVRVISRLRHVGHQAYFVGGCVRDLLLGRTPKDFDLATDAHPGEVRAIFRNCRLIGRRFRLAHVYFRGGKIIEVATFRANPIDVAEDVPGDADLLITRDNVFGTAEEDARRRDFTVNGLFYDPFLGEVIDYVGGRADLEARRIATIGDPEIRMREDPVRALRAIRFAARLGFTIEPEVFAAMRRHASELARCAPPRVLEEVFKILRCGGSGRAFDLLRASGALSVVLPSLAELLEAGEAGVRARLQAHLHALDEMVRSGEEISEAVLLGALLTHVRHGPAGDQAADGLLAQLVQTARLPRRIAERTRLALGAQELLHGPPRRRRRRRGGGLSAQAYFRDALQLLEMSVKATGEGAETLARWRSEAERHPTPGDGDRAEPPPEDLEGGMEREGSPGGTRTIEVDATLPGRPPGHPDPRGEESPGRRRRRRRGGRRRRRRGRASGAEAAGHSGADPVPSAGA
ncbi:MAG TPA: polynucleotide adenylyltransferase PcnB [Anaeromyxobacteraceae bacterium]|nr:polynucleotide adenylyltransferase PcnB [Anaeromyxobacteraceae bacterium]